jgi:4-alpha-glucanotransferase
MHLPPERKIAGLLAPLFALRHDEDLGVGDVRSLRELAAWCEGAGFRLIQLLPINETGGDHSPYMAVSASAIEPSTLEISPKQVPGLTAAALKSALAEVDLAPLRAGAVQYAKVKPLKLALLERAFDGFRNGAMKRNAPAGREFAAFREAEAAWLLPYARFRALMEANGGSERWEEWPEPHRSPDLADAWVEALSPAKRRAFEKRELFFQYVQWVAFRQWRAARKECEAHGVALMGDVPFGVSRHSADVWANPSLFRLDWSGGAPPEPAIAADDFVRRWGQNWGIPLYDWKTMQADGYAWWRQRVHLVRAIFHLFRVDHVLGFFRIYAFPWNPERNAEFTPLSDDEARALTGGRLPQFVDQGDDNEIDRERNRAHGTALLKILAADVGDHRLVGEDLGTVPPYVRPALAGLGIAGFKIPLWEAEPDGSLTPGSHYPRLSVATFATHDHEPLRAMWERWGERFAANERGEPGAAHAAWLAGEEMRRLMRFADLPEDQPVFTDAAHLGLLRALFASNSWIAALMITDLIGSAQRFNVPGAIADSNWSARLEAPVPRWNDDPALAPKLAAVRGMLADTGR